MEKESQKFFLAANSCEGFVSRFDEDFKGGRGKAYIIKGGPGTGKSSFLRYIAARSQDLGERIILCPCSSDPNSLDAVILPDREIILLDGTSPHVVEPKYPGACEEIVNLGEFWDGEALFCNKEEIIAVTDKNKSIHKTAAGYLAAAGEMLRDNIQMVKRAVNHKKCERFAEGICKAYIKSGKGFGRERVRFITGTTPLGVVTYHKTLDEFYKNAIIIEDKYGVAATEICEYVRKYALINGYDVLTLKNAFLPSSLTDHIIIPELDLCVASENDFCHLKSDARRIHARRFYELALLKAHKVRLSFNRRMFRDLIEIAAGTLTHAKSVHDELEKFYVDSMDFDAAAVFAKDFFLEKIAPYIQ